MKAEYIALRRHIEAARSTLATLEKQLEDARRADVEVIHAHLEWIYTSVETAAGSWDARDNDPDSFRVHAVLTAESEAAIAEHTATFGSYSGEHSAKHSVLYYRTKQNVMLHSGGGWLLLEDGIIVSDEDWQRMKSGTILPSDLRKTRGL